MKSQNWVIGWLILISLLMSIIAINVYMIDPYFHYHAPDTTKFFYVLDNQRSQNDGITRNFTYDAVITGTSMTEGFKASEVDEIFQVSSIKVPYSGASFKEINDNLRVAFKSNPSIKVVVRGLDYNKIIADKDTMRYDLGYYPTYLYDSNPFNDVKYVLNRDVILGRVCPMIINRWNEGFVAGITTFDDYSSWDDKGYKYGYDAVAPDEYVVDPFREFIHISDLDKEVIEGNIKQNVTELADEHPGVDFYYFFTPYSIANWVVLVNEGTICRQIEAEEYAIELILEHPNIHLYSFNACEDITTNLENYKDKHHYGPWINSQMLRWMKDGKYLLTKDNYKDYLQEEYEVYMTYDYTSIGNNVN